MPKRNCWEVKQCGRATGGSRQEELGVCPAATTVPLNGVNHGVNGGRACWAIAGTFCGGKVQGVFAEKLPSCLDCSFFTEVALEEGNGYVKTKNILEILS